MIGCICMCTSTLGSSSYSYDLNIKFLFFFFCVCCVSCTMATPVLFHTYSGGESKLWSFFPRWCRTQDYFCFAFFPALWELSFVKVGKNALCLLSNKMWNWVSESSFRTMVESYTDLGLIRKLIFAHLRSHSRSSDFSYHTFALVRGCSVTLWKLNHYDWPTLARVICTLLPLSSCPYWYKLGWWMSSPAGHVPPLQFLDPHESVSGQGMRHLHSRTSVWLQCSASYPCIQTFSA